MAGLFSQCCECGSGTAVIQRILQYAENFTSDFGSFPTVFFADEIYNTGGSLFAAYEHPGEIMPGGDPFRIEVIYIPSAQIPLYPIGGAENANPQSDDLYTYIGAQRFHQIGSSGTHLWQNSKLRIHHPALGSVGYYVASENPEVSGYDRGQSLLTWELTSVDFIEPPVDGYIDVSPNAPRDFGSLETGIPVSVFALAIFFPGVDTEFVPSTWTSVGSESKVFPL